MSRPTGPANLIAMGLLESHQLTHRAARPQRHPVRRGRLRKLIRRG